jgi:predicted secreted protein
MSITLGIAVYLVIWWVVLFAVLPFGVRSQHEDGPVMDGTDPGAPVAANMKLKMLFTTLVAGVLWAIVYLMMTKPPQWLLNLG